MDSNCQILREVTVNELFIIKHYLRKCLPKSTSIYLLLENYLKWLDKSETVSFEVLTFIDAQLTDVIICRLPDQDYNVIYSNDNKLNVLSNLWKTNRIKWTNETTFGALPMSHRSTILDCINKRGMSVRLEVKSVAHQLSRNDAANIQCVAPPGFIFRPLNRNDTQLVNDTWPYRFNGSEQFIGNMIDFNGGVMLTTENGEPIAWGLENNYGGAGILYSKPNYRKNGIGELVARALVKHVATSHHAVTCVNTIGNTSEKLISGLGFVPYDYITWLFLDDNLNKKKSLLYLRFVTTICPLRLSRSIVKRGIDGNVDLK